jgi:hypothetical protein
MVALTFVNSNVEHGLICQGDFLTRKKRWLGYGIFMGIRFPVRFAKLFFPDGIIEMRYNIHVSDHTQYGSRSRSSGPFCVYARKKINPCKS